MLTSEFSKASFPDTIVPQSGRNTAYIDASFALGRYFRAAIAGLDGNTFQIRAEKMFWPIKMERGRVEMVEEECQHCHCEMTFTQTAAAIGFNDSITKQQRQQPDKVQIIAHLSRFIRMGDKLWPPPEWNRPPPPSFSQNCFLKLGSCSSPLWL